ncbi:MAG: hypothetical protein H7Y17_01790 [Chlorobia bacterium]|nr:hypothetical protein [Fimbriimonadaceae bacterium]
MTNTDKVKLAARNNALWCDGMCRAHGQPTEFTDQLWICRGTPPRYHSNLTTLQPNAIEAVKQEMPGGFKDGFYDIDANSLGYKCLFEANWIWRDVAPGSTALRWERIATDDGLLAWEQGWALGDSEADNAPRQFSPSLLADPTAAFMAAHQGDEMVAGCILNVTDAVVGLSNTFSRIDGSEFWRDLPGVAHLAFPSYPIVGYERGEDLEHALAAGFQAIGPLRVWVS